MNEPANLRETLLKYRANELDDAERERIDVLMITDADFSDALQEAEYDLLDAYAADELSPEERVRVERAFPPEKRFSPVALISPRSFVAQPRPSVLPIDKAASHLPARRNWVLPLSIAAGLFFAVFLAIAAWQRHQASQAAVEQAATANGGSTLNGQPSVRPQVVADSANTSVPVERSAKGPEHAEALDSSHISSIATVLLPSVQRSSKASTLNLMHTVKTVDFVWPAAAESGSRASYQLDVVNDAGEMLCHTQVAVGSTKAGRQLLTFTCSASSIPSGIVFIRILPRPADSEAAPLLEVSLSVRHE